MRKAVAIDAGPRPIKPNESAGGFAANRVNVANSPAECCNSDQFRQGEIARPANCTYASSIERSRATDPFFCSSLNFDEIRGTPARFQRSFRAEFRDLPAEYENLRDNYPFPHHFGAINNRQTPISCIALSLVCICDHRKDNSHGR
jgi:hypothetical protein